MAALIDVLMVRLTDLEVQTKTLTDFHRFAECRKQGVVFPPLLGSSAKAIRKHFSGTSKKHVLVSFDGNGHWACKVYSRYLGGEFVEVTTPTVRSMILALEAMTPPEEERPHWCDLHSGDFSPHTYVQDEIVSRTMSFVFPEVAAFDALLRKFVLSFEESTDVREICKVIARVLDFLGERVKDIEIDIFEIPPELARISSALLAGDFVRGKEEFQYWYEVAFLFQTRCRSRSLKLKAEVKDVLREDCGVATAFGPVRLKKLSTILGSHESSQDAVHGCT